MFSINIGISGSKASISFISSAGSNCIELWILSREGSIYAVAVSSTTSSNNLYKQNFAQYSNRIDCIIDEDTEHLKVIYNYNYDSMMIYGRSRYIYYYQAEKHT